METDATQKDLARRRLGVRVEASFKDALAVGREAAVNGETNDGEKEPPGLREDKEKSVVELVLLGRPRCGLAPVDGQHGSATETDGLDEETQPKSVDEGPSGNDIGEPARVHLFLFVIADDSSAGSRNQGLLEILLLSHALLRIGDGDGGVNFGGGHVEKWR